MAKKCVSCGTDLPNDAGFCTECGAQQPEVRLCKQCGALLEKDALFCGECGTKYEDPNKQQTERPVIKAAPVTELKEEKKWTTSQMISIAVGVLVVLFLVIAIFNGVGENKGAVKKAEEAQAISVKAETMIDDYIRDQAKAEKEYKDKKIELTGKVSSKGQYRNSQDYYVTVGRRMAAGKSYYVLLRIPSKMAGKLNKLHIGDYVSAEGVCQGIVEQEDPTDVSIQIPAQKINEND